MSATGSPKVLACLREADLDFDIRHFDHRLMAQKMTFLLQELGVRTGYEGTFSFYLRGTYSPTLTKDLFAATAAARPMAPTLTQADKARIARFRAAIPLRPHVLEVVAAYRFLRKKGHSEDDAVRLLREAKPFLSPRDIAVGISKAKGILPEVTQADVASLNDEMAAWDAASDADDV